MISTTQIVPATYSMGAVFCWGMSDFLGGFASRKANAFLITAIAHLSGLIFMTSIALGEHAVFPSRTAVLWAMAGGLSGGGALALFYRALASGRMGLTAPVAAVLSAAIPVAFGIFREGLPHAVQIAGFMLAGLGIWLISRVEDSHRPEGLGLAVLSGIGFAGYYLCIRQAGDFSATGLAATSKIASVGLMVIVVLAARVRPTIEKPELAWGIIAGCLDVSGSVFYVRASQMGRLDTAVVLSSLYPAVTVLLARLVLDEHFTRWKAVGMFAAILAVPMIALQ